MQFLMLVCSEIEGSAVAPTDADRALAPDVEKWWQGTNDAGRYVLGDRLRPSAEAVTVRVRGGEQLVTEGPFTEVSELVCGFDVLECASMAEAVEVAAGHPMAHAGVIEVRAMWPFEEG